MDQKHLRELTGARFCAAMVVLLGHFAAMSSSSVIDLMGKSNGPAVCFFFVLSGFVLSLNYSQAFSNGLHRRQIFDFWRARFARIYPVYFLVLIPACPIMLWCLGRSTLLQSQAEYPTHRQLATAFLANVALVHIYVPSFLYDQFFNAPAWSIPTEMVFYLAFPFFAIWILPRLRSAVAIILAGIALYAMEIAAFILALAALHIGNHDIPKLMLQVVYMWPIFRIWEFFIGCCLGLLYLRRHLGLFSRRSFREIAVLVSICWYVAVGYIGIRGWAHYTHWYLLDTPAFCLLVFSLASGNTIWTPLLGNKIAILLGEASYSLYLLHGPVTRWLWVSYPPKGMPGSILILAVSGCIALSLISFRFIEVPARDALRPRRPRATVPIPGSAIEAITA